MKTDELRASCKAQLEMPDVFLYCDYDALPLLQVSELEARLQASQASVHADAEKLHTTFEESQRMDERLASMQADLDAKSEAFDASKAEATSLRQELETVRVEAAVRRKHPS